MRNVTSSFTIIFSLLLTLNAFAQQTAQQTAQQFLAKIPPLPQNICEANDEAIIKWNDRIIALKNEMTGLQANEKQQMERIQEKAQPTTGTFEPEKAERLQKLGEEISSIENNMNTFLIEITSSFVEKKGNIEIKYLGIMEALYSEKKEVIASHRNIQPILKRILTEKKNKCNEMWAIRKEFLMNYHSQLNELINLGIKGNNLSDEMNRLIYTNYTFRKQYGFWLDSLIGYVEELLHFYDDVPTHL